MCRCLTSTVCRSLLIIINLLFAVVTSLILVVAYLPYFKELDITEKWKRYDTFDETVLIVKIVSFLFFFYAVFAMTVSCCGNRLFFIILSVLSLVVALLQVGGALAFYYLLYNSFDAEAIKFFKSYDDEDNEIGRNATDYIQSTLKCCGFKKYEEMKIKHKDIVYPESCCSSPEEMSFDVKLRKVCKKVDYKDGCYKKVLIYGSTPFIMIFVLQVLSLIMSLIMICITKKKKRNEDFFLAHSNPALSKYDHDFSNTRIQVSGH